MDRLRKLAIPIADVVERMGICQTVRPLRIGKIPAIMNQPCDTPTVASCMQTEIQP